MSNLPIIEVTPRMIDSGLQEIRDHNYAGDLRYMLESVYRAMHYEALLAKKNVEQP